MNLKALFFISVSLSFSSALFAQSGTGQKVVVIDSGIYREDADFSSSRVIDEWCWSKPDRATLDSGPAPQFNDLEIASLCKGGGESDFTTSNAASMPRRVRHSSTPDEYPTHTFGTSHGTNVYNEALATAFDARYIIVTNAYYDFKNKITFNGQAGVQCGVHGPSGSFGPDGTIKPSNNRGCYTPGDAEREPAVIDRIISAGNVAAVNYSISTLNANALAANCALNNLNFQRLKNQNIAFVASAGNNGSSAPVGYPACNPNVIAVGALNANGTIADITSRGTDQIDFFADGVASDFFSASTSFAAPIVSGAFAIVQSAESRVRTVDEIKHALTEAATSSVTLNGRRIPVVTEASARAAATCLIDGTCISTAPPELDYQDGGQYGNFYGDDSPSYDLEIDFELITPPLPDNPQQKGSPQDFQQFKTFGDAIPSERDVMLEFDARRGSTSNRIEVYINGTRRFTTSFLSTSDRHEKFLIPRTMFQSGINTISLRPQNSSNSWGVSSVEANFTPVVPLGLNLLDSTLYGSNRNPERPTEMRVSFDLANTDNDLTFSATGFESGSPDEIEVYLNGRFYGTLTEAGPFSTPTASANPNVFTLNKDDLIEGTNLIEFSQKENASGGWGVTDMLVGLNSENAGLQLGVVNTGQFGNNYGTNSNTLEVSFNFVPLSENDHQISWRAFDTEQFGDLELFLNDIRIKNTNTTGSNATGATEKITIASRLFNAGVNSITFRTATEAFDDTWGVTNILVEPSPIIDLTIPANLGKDYGYYELVTGGVPAGWTRTYSGEEYQTRLYATFLNEGEDKTITLRGWGIDSPTEMAIYLNGSFLQYVTSAGASSIYSATDRIEIPVSNMVSGTNILSFRAANNFSEFQSEKWGIIFDGARNRLDINVAPIIMLLLDDEPPTP